MSNQKDHPMGTEGEEALQKAYLDKVKAAATKAKNGKPAAEDPVPEGVQPTKHQHEDILASTMSQLNNDSGTTVEGLIPEMKNVKVVENGKLVTRPTVSRLFKLRRRGFWSWLEEIHANHPLARYQTYLKGPIVDTTKYVSDKRPLQWVGAIAVAWWTPDELIEGKGPYETLTAQLEYLRTPTQNEKKSGMKDHARSVYVLSRWYDMEQDTHFTSWRPKSDTQKFMKAPTKAKQDLIGDGTYHKAYVALREHWTKDLGMELPQNMREITPDQAYPKHMRFPGPDRGAETSMMDSPIRTVEEEYGIPSRGTTPFNGGQQSRATSILPMVRKSSSPTNQVRFRPDESSQSSVANAASSTNNSTVESTLAEILAKVVSLEERFKTVDEKFLALETSKTQVS